MTTCTDFGKIKLELSWKGSYDLSRNGMILDVVGIDIKLGKCVYEIFATLNTELSPRETQPLDFTVSKMSFEGHENLEGLVDEESNAEFSDLQNEIQRNIPLSINLVKAIEISVRAFQVRTATQITPQGDVNLNAMAYRYDISIPQTAIPQFETNGAYVIIVSNEGNNLLASIEKKV